MRVKIGNTWYSSDEQPILVNFEGKDKENIASMQSTATFYAVAPNNHFKSDEDFRNWMDG